MVKLSVWKKGDGVGVVVVVGVETVQGLRTSSCLTGTEVKVEQTRKCRVVEPKVSRHDVSSQRRFVSTTFRLNDVSTQRRFDVTAFRHSDVVIRTTSGLNGK